MMDNIDALIAEAEANLRGNSSQKTSVVDVRHELKSLCVDTTEFLSRIMPREAERFELRKRRDKNRNIRQYVPRFGNRHPF